MRTIARIGAVVAFVAFAHATCASATAATLSVQVTDPAAVAVEDAVVHVVPVSGKAPQRAPLPAVIDQVNRRFVPLVSVVQVGTQVSFPNKDDIRHQVYSFSPAKTFDLKLYSGVPSQPVVFDKPGLVVLGCNIHDRMVAYLLVVDTPWFARSGADGVARIDLPPGDYVVHAGVYRSGSQAEVKQTVRIAADTAMKLAIDPGSGS